MPCQAPCLCTVQGAHQDLSCDSSTIPGNQNSHSRTLLAVYTSQFAACLMHFTSLSVVVCLCSAVAGFTAALGWFFCPGGVDFIVEKCREALREAIILCAVFRLLMFCCFLIFLFPKKSYRYLCVCLNACIPIYMYIYIFMYIHMHTYGDVYDGTKKLLLNYCSVPENECVFPSPIY